MMNLNLAGVLDTVNFLIQAQSTAMAHQMQFVCSAIVRSGSVSYSRL